MKMIVDHTPTTKEGSHYLRDENGEDEEHPLSECALRGCDIGPDDDEEEPQAGGLGMSIPEMLAEYPTARETVVKVLNERNAEIEALRARLMETQLAYASCTGLTEEAQRIAREALDELRAVTEKAERLYESQMNMQRGVAAYMEAHPGLIDSKAVSEILWIFTCTKG